MRLTADGKLSVFSLKDKFNLRTVEELVTVNGIETCVLIPFDEHGDSRHSFANVPSLKITGESKGMMFLLLFVECVMDLIQ